MRWNISSVRGSIAAVLILAGVWEPACGAGWKDKVVEDRLGRMPKRIVHVVRSATSEGCRVALVAQTGQKQFVVVDGQPGPQHDWIGKGSLVFSADGKRVAYVARQGGKCMVVVDGQPGSEYDGIVVGPVFLKDGAVQYISIKGDVLFRVEHRP